MTSTIKIALLGQCCFTYQVLNHLILSGWAPHFVLIERDEVDYDPFKGCETIDAAWYQEHLLYHYTWVDRIKALCHQHKINLLMGKDIITELPPSDALLVAGYANKVTKEVTDSFNGWALNIHPSMLPRFKGPQPEAQMILQNTLEFTGVTIHQITDRWDSGPILWQKPYRFNSTMTVGKMEAIEAELAVTGLISVFESYPVLNRYPSDKTASSSYYSWYDEAVLSLSKEVFLHHLPEHLFRLRPEGYAYIPMEQGKLYPIFDFSKNRNLNALPDNLLGAMQVTGDEVQILDADSTFLLIKEM